MNETNFSQEALVEKYKPLSPWAYLGYILLFCIPIVNLIAIIIFAFTGENINRKNFARAYLIICVLSAILSAIVVFIMGGIGAYIYGTADDLVDDSISQIDSMQVIMFNSQLEQYGGDNALGVRVNRLIELVDELNNQDTIPHDIIVIGGSNIDTSAKYKISFEYDFLTNYIDTVIIEKK